MNDFHVIIPARLQSTRLPEKALANIGSKAMILHVCDKAQQSGATSVTVATDSNRILEKVKAAGFNCVMTRDDHVSGSDRVFEASQMIGLSDEDIIVNVQGDEPFIPPENIRLVASLINQSTGMATLCCPIKTKEEYFDPNAVKVVMTNDGHAIYFSRAQIPYLQDQQEIDDHIVAKLNQQINRHIGIYAYRKSFLQSFIEWPQGHLEKLESLEQLRVLENGNKIAISRLAKAPPPGVDTPSDLEQANNYLKNNCTHLNN